MILYQARPRFIPENSNIDSVDSEVEVDDRIIEMTDYCT